MLNMKIILSFASAAAILFCTTPAMARWEYTMWGMSPEEVIQASNNQVVLREDRPDDRLDNLYPLATSIFEQDGHSLRVTFYFEPTSRTLRLVTLTPEVPNGKSANMDPMVCDAIIQRAEKTFGQQSPVSSKLDLGNVQLPIQKWAWSSPDDKGDIEISDIRDERYGIVMCKLLYYAPA